MCPVDGRRRLFKITKCLVGNSVHPQVLIHYVVYLLPDPLYLLKIINVFYAYYLHTLALITRQFSDESAENMLVTITPCIYVSYKYDSVCWILILIASKIVENFIVRIRVSCDECFNPVLLLKFI